MNANKEKIIAGRNISALLNPRPVVLVTCCDENAAPNVLSLAWHTPVSHDPPLLGISVDRRRYSHKLIADGGEFTVNVMGRDFQSAIELCGNCSGTKVNKIDAAGLHLKPAHCVRPPLITEALAHLECAVCEQIDAGDHCFFIANVLYAAAREDCFSNYWDTEKGNVLLCLQRDKFAIPSDNY